MKNIHLAVLVFVAMTHQGVAASLTGGDSIPPSLPGSVFAVPPTNPANSAPAVEDEEEFTSDMPIFLQKGFSVPNWETHTDKVQQVLKDLVLPDWKKRTGSSTDPDLPSIDIAAEYVLGGDFNDLMVMSRLPGDCGPEGCLFQLYSLVNEVWVKRFEFKTVGFAWKRQEGRPTVVAQVGGMWIPSKTYLWSDGRLR